MGADYGIHPYGGSFKVTSLESAGIVSDRILRTTQDHGEGNVDDPSSHAQGGSAPRLSRSLS